MKKDDLTDIWQEGNKQLFSEKKTDKDMISQYLNEKTLKGNRSVQFNVFFYGLIQLANIILLSMNISGYMNNTSMVWFLVAQLAVSIGILVFGIDLFYRFREINNYSDSLGNLIRKSIRFYRRPYEGWLIVSSVSAILLAINLNLLIDNQNGSYVINNKALVIGILVAALLFIYGSQKLVSIRTFRALKAYLDDLNRGVLDQSQKIERARKRYMWIWISAFIVLTFTMILGIIKAIG